MDPDRQPVGSTAEGFAPRGGAMVLDELYVVSDLHLGGAAGRQIFGSALEFEALVGELMLRPRKRQVGLLINGDFVDFLAETEPGPAPREFNPQRASAVLDSILNAEPFAPVWRSLRALLQTEGRSLIVNIGNHDLELALPWVREQLCHALAGGDASARGRLHLALDGAGVLCQVGNATVLCVHGNDVDGWNCVDHGALQRIGRALLRGRAYDAWAPNGGSRLVTRVLNPLKREFPYVDLLKPEGVAVFDLLRAMGAELGDKVDDLAVALGMVASHAVQMRRGQLGEPPPDAADASMRSDGRVPAAPLPPDLTPAALAEARVAKRQLADELIRRARHHLRSNLLPMDLVAGGRSELQLDGFVTTVVTTMRSFGYAAASWLGGGSREAVLRNALRVLVGDRSFAIDQEDDTYRELVRQTSDEIDILVAGHTHLERALPRTRGFYFNSGTWSRLMRLGDELLDDSDEAREKFRGVFARLHGARTMAEIDASGLVLKRPCVVAILADGPRTLAELRHVVVGGPGVPVMQTVEGSQFAADGSLTHA